MRDITLESDFEDSLREAAEELDAQVVSEDVANYTEVDSDHVPDKRYRFEGQAGASTVIYDEKSEEGALVSVEPEGVGKADKEKKVDFGNKVLSFAVYQMSGKRSVEVLRKGEGPDGNKVYQIGREKN